jgi:hypothetical protein
MSDAARVEPTPLSLFSGRFSASTQRRWQAAVSGNFKMVVESKRFGNPLAAHDFETHGISETEL